mgnify:CR=1 FL=1
MKKNKNIDYTHKVTLDGLVKRATEKAELAKTPINIYVPSLGGVIEFERPKPFEVDELIEQMSSGDISNREANAILIYNSCSMLQDSSLHDELGVKDPIKVVEKIFTTAEIGEIGDKLYSHDVVEGEIEVVKN